MPPRKRSRPEPAAAARRRSGRLSSTPKKSAYFEDDDEDTAGSEDERPPPAKKPRGRPRKAPPPPASHEPDDQYKDDEARDGEEDEGDGDDDEDAPPRVEIIPLEKMRDEGGVAYEPHRLHRNTLLFLEDLKANNKRTWLKSHDGEYRRALKDWQSFVETTTQRVIEIDETVPELPIKDVSFRIHRDIRFSKDPTPYKPHFSAAWSRTGRKGPYACYYMHCEPGSSFIGGGLWHPEAALVAKLRRSIDQHPRRWRRALDEPLLRAAFFPALDAAAGPEEAVKAFVRKNQDSALKKRPMGWDVTHRDIELLKLRSYTLGAKIDAEMLCDDAAQQSVQALMRALSGFISFLNSIVMPDPSLDGDDDETSTDGDGGDES